MGKDLKRLFLAHRREIQAYLTERLRDADLAADLTQETFLCYAERTQASGAPITHDRSYLYRTARNLAIDQSRRLARRRTDVVANQDLWRVCRKTARRRNAPPTPAGSSTDCARPSKSCRNERGRSSSSAAWKA